MFTCSARLKMTAAPRAPVHTSPYTAVVVAADGVRFAVAAAQPDELVTDVVRYVGERCDDTLWPADAQQVRELIEDRRPYAAIALYFANVGDRWDVERLELGGLSFGRD